MGFGGSRGFGRRALFAGCAATCGAAFVSRRAARGADAGDAVDTVFQSGLWFDGQSFVPRAATYVSGTAFAVSPVPGRSVSRVDLGGKFVVPAYGDAFAYDAVARATDAIRRRFAAAGIYYARASDLDALPAHDPDDEPDQLADVLFAHAPFARARRPGDDVEGKAFHRVASPADVPAALAAAVAARADFVVAYAGGATGIDAASLAALVARAKSAGLRIVARVTAIEDARVALAASVAAVIWPSDASVAFTAADATLAARGNVAVLLTASGVRDAASRAATRAGVAALRARGVALALAGDGGQVSETARALAEAGVFSKIDALRALCIATPQSIFPGRKIGVLAPGYEANFLVLDASPLADLANLTQIALRFKSGRPVVIGGGT